MSFDTFLINQKINKECLFKSCISNTCVNNHNNTLPIIYDNTNPEREKNMILLNSSSIDNNGRTSIKLLNNKLF